MPVQTSKKEFVAFVTKKGYGHRSPERFFGMKVHYTDCVGKIIGVSTSRRACPILLKDEDTNERFRISIEDMFRIDV